MRWRVLSAGSETRAEAPESFACRGLPHPTAPLDHHIVVVEGISGLHMRVLIESTNRRVAAMDSSSISDSPIGYRAHGIARSP